MPDPAPIPEPKQADPIELQIRRILWQQRGADAADAGDALEKAAKQLRELVK